MTTTDEFIRQNKPTWLLDEEPEPREDDWLGADASAWVERRHRRNLRLIATGALGFGLALALGLSAAWQIDRWAADWHYGGPTDYTLPEHSSTPAPAE